MSEHELQREREFEQHTKQLFDESTAALDGATRARLTRARHRALQELAPRRDWRWSVVPAGAIAAAALLTWLIVPPSPPPMDPGLQATSLNDLEILLGEEDLEMLDEELEFYGWLEEQPEFASVDDSVG